MPPAKKTTETAAKKSTARKAAPPAREVLDEPYPGDASERRPGQVQLAPISMITAKVPIIGETQLIPHKWSEKALRMMREKQSGVAARQKRDPKDPKEEAEAATYYLPDGRPGVKATAFKCAIVDGGTRLFDGLTSTAARQWVRVDGIPDEDGNPLVPIKGRRKLREDPVRNATGVADLRYRYGYWPWSAVLEITFPERFIDIDSIVRLVNGGGLAGVGDGRPSSPKSKTGTFGCFIVDTSKDIALDQYFR